MKKLSSNPTKSEEIEHIAQFFSELPDDSYLKSILGPAVADICERIKNDFGHRMEVETENLVGKISPKFVKPNTARAIIKALKS